MYGHAEMHAYELLVLLLFEGLRRYYQAGWVGAELVKSGAAADATAASFKNNRHHRAWAQLAYPATPLTYTDDL